MKYKGRGVPPPKNPLPPPPDKMDNVKIKLIEVQKEYIKFLGDELSRHESMIFMAPTKDIINRGGWLRNMIAIYEDRMENE